jgi:hypothetical protein
MKLRNFSPRTEQSYVAAMMGLVKYYRRSPDQLTQDEIRARRSSLARWVTMPARSIDVDWNKSFQKL